LIAPLGKCPYCGFGHVSTLDHYLSKARYPGFAVLPTNLVPCCGDCNHGKGAGVSTANNQIPHPYYEAPAIETDTWLFASIEETTPARAQYSVLIPPGWPAALALRVQNYFRDLELAARFAVEAASEIVSLSDLLAHRPNISDGSAGAKAMDYTLKRWDALTRFLEDPQLAIDNNLIENKMRPIAIGRKNWLFAGSLRAGKRSAAIMSLIQSAKMNGHDPFLYLKDVLERLPTQKNHLIHELLPHNWQPKQA